MNFRRSTANFELADSSVPTMTKCSFIKTVDSAQGSLTSEEGDTASEDSDPAHLHTDIQEIINRLDITKLSSDLESDDGFFSTASSTTINTTGADCDTISEDTQSISDDVFDNNNSSKVKPRLNGSPGKPALLRATSWQQGPSKDVKKKRRISEPIIRQSRFGSLMRKLSWNKGDSDIPQTQPQKPQPNKVKNGKPFSPGSVMRLEVQSLPQVFFTKYLGYHNCSGIWGPEFTRGPVDSMIGHAKSLGDQEELPLVQLTINKTGIDARPCPRPDYSPAFSPLLLPIEFISYGVQDSKYTRVFTCIVVKEMSSKGKKMECHAFMCDSSINARKLALSVALAFKVYAKILEGKSYRFQLDLSKKPEENSDKIKTKEKPGSEYEV